MATTVNENFRVSDYSKDVLIQLDDDIYRGLIKCGLLAEGYAKMMDTVDTGRLRNSITYSVKTQQAGKHYKWNKGKKSKRPPGEGDTISHGGEKEHTLYIGTNVYYAP